MTSNTRLARAPGNVMVAASISGLPRDSVANVSRILTLDRRRLDDYISSIPTWILEAIFQGIDTVLGRPLS